MVGLASCIRGNEKKETDLSILSNERKGDARPVGWERDTPNQTIKNRSDLNPAPSQSGREFLKSGGDFAATSGSLFHLNVARN
jgi:hypothetical protein